MQSDVAASERVNTGRTLFHLPGAGFKVLQTVWIIELAAGVMVRRRITMLFIQSVILFRTVIGVTWRQSQNREFPHFTRRRRTQQPDGDASAHTEHRDEIQKMCWIYFNRPSVWTHKNHMEREGLLLEGDWMNRFDFYIILTRQLQLQASYWCKGPH